jgi:hypothetical protein
MELNGEIRRMYKGSERGNTRRVKEDAKRELTRFARRSQKGRYLGVKI